MIHRPTLFLLHGLGLDRGFWTPLCDALGDAADCVALDLPGFGAAAASSPLTVEATVDWLEQRIRERLPDRWMLVGHSMSGKFATILTAAAARGERRLPPPAGLVLVAASPPAPEPMSADKRAEMRAWWAAGTISEADAGRFVDDNLAGPLSPERRLDTVAAVRGSKAEAWLDWLDRGSLEDWAETVATTTVPTLVIAGADDAALGAEAQRRLTLPHFLNARLETVAHASHFVPLEQPAALAAQVLQHWARIEETLEATPPRRFVELMLSDRVSARTRQALLARLAPPPPDATGLFSAGQQAVLAALVGRLLPQPAADRLDLPGRLCAALARGAGDGWRPAELPEDRAAWRIGLDSVQRRVPDFLTLDGPAQDRSIAQLLGDEAPDAPDGATDGATADTTGLDAAALRSWLGEVRRLLASVWLAHPATLAAIGYDGFATGGDGVRKQGYQRTAAGTVEHWQIEAGTAVAGAAR